MNQPDNALKSSLSQTCEHVTANGVEKCIRAECIYRPDAAKQTVVQQFRYPELLKLKAAEASKLARQKPQTQGFYSISLNSGTGTFYSDSAAKRK